ncbi:MAG: hypothetical protein ABI856_20320, partial [Nitrospira sp.]
MQTRSLVPFPMFRLSGVRSFMLVVLSVLLIELLISIDTQPAVAACSNTDQCSSDRVCLALKGLPGIGKECRPLPCNADSDCPSARPRCLMGICQNPGFNPNTPPGAGTTQAGVGETCGPYKIGQVT